MRNHNKHNTGTLAEKSCTDPIVGAILSGWRYDISSISPEMRTDYEQHLSDCHHCRRRQHKARTIDVLLIVSCSLSMVAFLMAALVLRRVELLEHIPGTLPLPVHLRQHPVTISLEAAAIVGLAVSTILWVLVAIATPLPGLFSSLVEQRIPQDIRQRFARRHA